MPTARKSPRIDVALVALGGAIGAVARYGVWNLEPGRKWLLVSTFGLNVAGCFVLGAALGYLTGMTTTLAKHSRTTVLGLAFGFTTFSFYALQGVTYDNAWASVIYVIVTPVGAVSALAAGALITSPPGRRLPSKRAQSSSPRFGHQ